MLDHPTLNRLRELKLDGMAEAFAELQRNDDAAALSHAEWLGLLIDREATHRSTKRYQSRMRAAKLRHVGATIEDVNYRAPRQLDRDLFRQLAHGDWIERRQNLILTGPCGVGKTWLACALGQKACRDGKTVLYHRLPRLFADLELAQGDGSFPRMFRQLVRTDLLILDDWGPDRLTAMQRRHLMEIVEDRYQTASIAITSQLPVEAWHEVIGDPPSRTQSSTASSTTPTASPSTGHPCERPTHENLHIHRRARRRASVTRRARPRARLPPRQDRNS